MCKVICGAWLCLRATRRRSPSRGGKPPGVRQGASPGQPAAAPAPAPDLTSAWGDCVQMRHAFSKMGLSEGEGKGARGIWKARSWVCSPYLWVRLKRIQIGHDRKEGYAGRQRTRIEGAFGNGDNGRGCLPGKAGHEQAKGRVFKNYLGLAGEPQEQENFMTLISPHLGRRCGE